MYHKNKTIHQNKSTKPKIQTSFVTKRRKVIGRVKKYFAEEIKMKRFLKDAMILLIILITIVFFDLINNLLN